MTWIRVDDLDGHSYEVNANHIVAVTVVQYTKDQDEVWCMVIHLSNGMELLERGGMNEAQTSRMASTKFGGSRP